MKKILSMLVLILLGVQFVVAESVEKNVDLQFKIYYEGEREFRIRIYEYDEETDKTFSWAESEEGDTTRWNPTIEVKIDDELEKIDLPFKVYFIDARHVKIRVYGHDLDAENEFVWSVEEDGTYADWNPSINYMFELTEEEENIENIKIWKNLTLELAQSRQELVNVTLQCAEIIRLNNESHLIARDYADLKEGVGNQGAKLEQCKEVDLPAAKTKADQYDSCNSALTTKHAALTTCNANLEEEKNKTTSNPLLWGVIGAVCAYFFLKKKEAKPQEYKDMGGVPPS